MYMLAEALRRSYCARLGARHEDPHAERRPGDELLLRRAEADAIVA